MKKTKLLVLPLMALLLSSCATTIKGSDMPTLTKDPGSLLKMSMSTSTSGDKDIIAMMDAEDANADVSIEIYSNFAKLSVKAKEGDKNVSNIVYLMLKDNVTYVLSDEDGQKSKTEIPDPTGLGFKGGLISVLAPAMIGVLQAQSLYDEMSSVKEDDSKYTLKRSGSVYTLSFSDEMGDYDMDNVGKLTIKNDYFSAFEMVSTISKDSKKATSKMSANFTYGREVPSYAESKMPKPADFK